MKTLLSISDLRKDLGGVPVLRIGHCQLAAGEVAWLGGQNGAGKTTLLRILAGLLTADSYGHFSVAGDNQPAPPKVAYLHQTPHLLNRTVRENVAYGVRCCRLPPEQVDSAMTWAGITPLADRPAITLSGGEKHLVALSRVRALNPEFYLLDEPTTHLDTDTGERIRALIGRLREEGRTAIVSSHDPAPSGVQTWTLKDKDLIR